MRTYLGDRVSMVEMTSFNNWSIWEFLFILSFGDTETISVSHGLKSHATKTIISEKSWQYFISNMATNELVIASIALLLHDEDEQEMK